MRRFRLGTAGRGVLFLLSGTVGAQLITLATMPVLSRLYSPAEFGYFSLVLALAGMVAPIATLRLETAVVLPDSLGRVRALTWIAITAMTFIALFYGLGLQIASISGIYDLSNYSMISVWVALLVWLTAAFALFGQLVLRDRKYNLIAKRSFLQAIVTNGVQVGLGAFGKNIPGLIIGQLSGRSVGILALVQSARRYLRRPPKGSLGASWKEFWRFPFIFAPSALLNSVGLQAPLVFITILHGVSIGGQVGMAERIVAIPITVIGAAISQAIDAEASRVIRKRTDSLSRLYGKFSLFLLFCGLLVAVGGWLLAEKTIPFLLGEEWSLAGTVVKVIAITSGVRLVATPVSRIIALLQRAAANTILDVFRVVSIAFAMWASVYFSLDIIETIWFLYSSLTLTYAVTWIYGYVIVKRSPVN